MMLQPRCYKLATPAQRSVVLRRTHRCCATSLETKRSRPYHRADSLLPHSRKNHEYWRGYIGNWHLDVQDPAKSRKIHGLRTFKWRDASREVLDQVVVLDAEKPPARRRDLDGLYQANSFFDHSNPNQDQEDVVVAADDRTLHLLAVDHNACGQVEFALPPVALTGSSASGSSLASPFWGTELFLWDGFYRWSASVLYDRETGDLAHVNLIQEAFTDIKPSTAHVTQVGSFIIPDMRPSLDPEPATWVTERLSGLGVARGVFTDMRDGGRLHMGEEAEAVGWEAPSTDRHPVNCVVLLPDSMYLFLPVSLALITEDKASCRIEFGGALRHVHGSDQHANTAATAHHHDKLFDDFPVKKSSAPPAEAPPSKGFQRITLDYDVGSGLLSNMVRERYAES